MTIKNPSLNRFVVWSLLVVASLTTNAIKVIAAESSREQERKYIAVLQSDAPPGDKAIACKKLAIYGTKDAVPALAPLLGDKDLSSWARIAFEAMTDPAADDALREAMAKVQGTLLIGVINSIGYRRDAKAVTGLAGKLKDADAEVAAAAAVALGCIGGEQATKALEQALPGAPDRVRSAIAEGCVLCAEKFLADGKSSEAIRLYDLIRQANVPEQRKLEATRGAILARKSAGLPLLLEQLRSADKMLFRIGLRTARELPGREVTEALAAEVERSGLDRQPLLILVLGDRADVAALPAIQKAAQSGPKEIRMAAITALDHLASVEGVPTLLDITAEADQDLAQAARAALARLPGKAVDERILAYLPKAPAKSRQVLIELAGQRQITAALPVIAGFAEDADAGIRSAAIGAIGALGDERQAAELVKLLEKPSVAGSRGDLEKALLAICGRRGASCTPSLLPLAQHNDGELRIIGLHTLASVGGPRSLSTVKAAVNDNDQAVQDEAVRTLSTWPNSWPDDAAAAEPLLELAKSGKKLLHQVLGVRGYLQYIQGDKQLANDVKAGKVAELMPAIKRPEEKRLAIAALGNIPATASLEQLLALAGDPALVDDACSALATLASRGDVQGASKELRQKALQTAIDKSSDNNTKQKARKALQGIR